MCETLTIEKRKKSKDNSIKIAAPRKRLVIGDIHGHLEPFKSIYEAEKPDDVIILGDYFDSFHGTDKEIIDCFKEILKMQKAHKKGEFILLIGNHDFHYIYLIENYSGKRKSYEMTVSVMLDKCIEKNLLQYVYVDDINKTVYSHAGIMNKWMSENRVFTDDLNDLNILDPRKYMFTHRGGDTGYGDGPYASPIWVRPSALEKDMYVDLYGSTWTQIVGHTPGSKARTMLLDGTWINGCHVYNRIDDSSGLNVPLLYVIDALPNYYIVEELAEDGELISREVKCTKTNLDKAINDKIQIHKAIQRDQDIKKLAEMCGIKLATPI